MEKLKEKKLLIPLIVGIAVLLLVGIILFMKNKETAPIVNKEQAEKVEIADMFDPNKPIRIEKDEKYGYINVKGEEIVKPIYDDAGLFKGNYAVVAIKDLDKPSYENKKYQIIDKTGKVKLNVKGSIKPKYNDQYNFWVIDSALYNSNFKRITKEGVNVSTLDNGYLKFEDSIKGLAGVMNYKGKVIFSIPETTLSIDISGNKDGSDDLYMAVKSYSTDKKNIIDLKTGKVLFTAPDGIRYITAEEDGIFSYYKDTYDNKTFLYFRNGKLVYKTTDNVYDMNLYSKEKQILEIDYGYKYKEKGLTERYQYYDIKKEKLTTEKPIIENEYLGSKITTLINYGFKEYKSGSKVGITDGENVIVPAEYDDVDLLSLSIFKYMKDKKGQELVLVKANNQTSLMNIKDKKVINTFDSTYIYSYTDSPFLKATQYKKGEGTSNKYIMYNILTNKSMEFPYESIINAETNHLIVTLNGKKTYYNNNLEKIYEITSNN